MSEWSWCMDYCKNLGIPPAQKWAWGMAKKAYAVKENENV